MEGYRNTWKHVQYFDLFFAWLNHFTDKDWIVKDLTLTKERFGLYFQIWEVISSALEFHAW